MRTKKIVRLRGQTIKQGIATESFKVVLDTINSCMLSVANFDAEQDTARDFRRCLTPVYALVAELMNAKDLDVRPKILQGVKKISHTNLYGFGAELLIAAGYLKISFSIKIENTVQNITVILLPEGRRPAVPALMAAGKMDPENPILL